jgi:regulation of enolase protein 1 (concanavalin A-like superfamily)
LALPTNLIGGPFITYNSGSTVKYATFSSVEVTPFPAPWVTADIGTTGIVGSAMYYPTTFTLTGGGSTNGKSESFRFAHQTISGDGSITARIPSSQNTGSNTRVGVMIRDSLSNNSKMVWLAVDGSSTYRWIRRSNNNGNATTSSVGSGTAPNRWVRITRVGSTFTAYTSTNGTGWTNVGSTSIAMAANCYMGMAVMSGSTSTANTSTFDNVTGLP